MKEKFVTKWMKIAKQLADDNDACYSRKIGVVIVDPVANAIRGTGYNGPAPDTPHCDTRDFLENFFWPQLTLDEKRKLCDIPLNNNTYNAPESFYEQYKQLFLDKYSGCGQCPRRLVNAASGQRNELCSCGHAERHAITNAGLCHGMVMFCYCGVPCIQCTDAILQAGIREVYHLDDKPDYHPVSRFLFDRKGVSLIEVKRSDFEGVSPAKT